MFSRTIALDPCPGLQSGEFKSGRAGSRPKVPVPAPVPVPDYISRVGLVRDGAARG